MMANVLTSVILLVATAFFAWHEQGQPWTPLRLAGALVALVGVVLVLIARAQLGKSFSVTAQARELVTTGLYSRIRNPIYYAGFLVISGLAMYLRKPALLGFAVLLIPLQIRRARKEAAVLREAFGERYDRYRAGTWF